MCDAVVIYHRGQGAYTWIVFDEGGCAFRREKLESASEGIDQPLAIFPLFLFPYRAQETV